MASSLLRSASSGLGRAHSGGAPAALVAPAARGPPRLPRRGAGPPPRRAAVAPRAEKPGGGGGGGALSALQRDVARFCAVRNGSKGQASTRVLFFMCLVTEAAARPARGPPRSPAATPGATHARQRAQRPLRVLPTFPPAPRWAGRGRSDTIRSPQAWAASPSAATA
jgi:hypothetical protein